MNEKLHRYLNAQLTSVWLIEPSFLTSELSRIELVGVNYQSEQPFEILEKSQLDFVSTKGKQIKGNVAVVRHSGIMTTASVFARGIDEVSDTMYKMYDDKTVSGIMLDINTGGGSEEAASKLAYTLSDRNKPVVVFSGGLASAGIKGVLGADEIIASNARARFGSIGAYGTINKKFLDELAETTIELYGAGSPRKNEAIRAAKRGDYSLLQMEIDDSDQRFKDEVVAARHLDISDPMTSETISGAMFYANEAKRRGLIDIIATRKMAIDRLISHTNN